MGGIDESETLDAYDQGRIDTNERFLRILEDGNRQTTTKEELLAFLLKEMGSLDAETEGTGNEQI